MPRKRKTNKPAAKKVVRHAPPPRSTVYGRESATVSWNETIDVKIMSRFGAGFDVLHEQRVGTLISLEIALPRDLRAFDLDKPLYSVIALVQHCGETRIGPVSGYHMSVIFVAKEFPDSYFADPQQAYRLSGSARDGLWNIVECSSQYKPRQFPRFPIKLDVEVSLIQREERSILKEQTVTRDVGASGASVITSLDARIGDKVKFACRDIDFYAIAIVVNRRNVFGVQDRLHLKFVDEKFPIARVLFSEIGEAATA